jgi:hypothetical protein
MAGNSVASVTFCWFSSPLGASLSAHETRAIDDTRMLTGIAGQATGVMAPSGS